MSHRRTKTEILFDSLKKAGIDVTEATKITALAKERMIKSRKEKIKAYQKVYSPVYNGTYKISDENFKDVMLKSVDNEVHYRNPLSVGAINHLDWQEDIFDFKPASELTIFPRIHDTDDDYQFAKLVYRELADTRIRKKRSK